MFLYINCNVDMLYVTFDDKLYLSKSKFERMWK